MRQHGPFEIPVKAAGILQEGDIVPSQWHRRPAMAAAGGQRLLEATTPGSVHAGTSFLIWRTTNGLTTTPLRPSIFTHRRDDDILDRRIAQHLLQRGQNFRQ